MPPAAAISGLVRIIGAGDRDARGTGFLVGDGERIATCTHLCRDADGLIAARVRIRLVGEDRDRWTLVERSLPPDEGDIAILRLEEVTDGGCRGMPLGRSASLTEGDQLHAHGFPLVATNTGSGTGALVELVSAHVELEGVPALQLRSAELTQGFSGSPLLNAEGLVVGVVHRAFDHRTDPLERGYGTAFARPVEVVRRLLGRLELENPYQGLDSFSADVSDRFFGRDPEIGALLDLLLEHDTVVVLGASGMGKSSLVRAGLHRGLNDRTIGRELGWLRAQERFRRHHVALVFPGTDALRTLTRATATEAPSILVIDQFERLFVENEAQERARFVECLRAVAQRSKVIISLSAAFYGAALLEPGLDRLLPSAGHLLVGPMDDSQVRLAILEPAHVAGVAVEGELIDALIRDARGQAGSLPLLQYALDRIWVIDAQSGLLRLETYLSLGGLAGVIESEAEERWGSLGPDDRLAAEALLGRLIRSAPGPTSDSSVTTARAPIAELEDAHLRVARDFAAVRLLTEARDPSAGTPTFQLAHEALLRSWPRLRTLAEQRAPFLRWRRDQFEPWFQTGELLAGVKLASAQDWVARHEIGFSRQERDFVARSAAAARRRRLLSRAVTLAVAGLALLSTFLALQARRETARVRAEQRSALSRGLAAQTASALNDNLDTASLLSLEAYRAKPTIEARNAVLTVLSRLGRRAGSFPGDSTYRRLLAYSPGDARVDRPPAPLPVEARSDLNVVFSHDGRTLASIGQDQTALLWDVSSRRPLEAVGFRGGQSVVSGAFSADDKVFVTASYNGWIHRWDARTGRPLGITSAACGPGPSGAMLNDDGTVVACQSPGGTVRARSSETSRELGPPLPVGGQVVAVSPDGEKLAATTSPTGFKALVGIALWDTKKGRMIARVRKAQVSLIRQPRRVPVAAVFSPDGNTFAFASDFGVRLWDVRGRHGIGKPLTGHRYGVEGLAFSRDGRTLASAGGVDGAVRLWDTRTRRAIDEPLTGDERFVAGLAFGPGDARLASTSTDGTPRLWNTEGYPLRKRVGDSLLAFDPSGGNVAAGAGIGGIRLLDLKTGRTLGEPLSRTALYGGLLAFSRDGKIASVSFERPNELQLWDAATHRAVGKPLGGSQEYLEFSLDGKMLASVSSSGTVRLWDVGTRRLVVPPFRGGGVAFRPDGKLLAYVADDEGKIRLWDVSRRRAVSKPSSPLHSATSTLAYSPSGRILAAGRDLGVQLWDASTLRPLGGVLAGFRSGARDLAFSPDGKTLAVTDGHETLRLYDVATRRPLGAPLRGNHFVAFSPDGQTLASDEAPVHDFEYADAVLWDSILWSDDAKAFQNRICVAVGHSLSRAAWHDFLPHETYHATCP